MKSLAIFTSFLFLAVLVVVSPADAYTYDYDGSSAKPGKLDSAGFEQARLVSSRA